MSEQMTRSSIYLGAILPLMADLIEIDPEAAKLAQGWNCTIMFHVGGGGPATTLRFQDGKCTAQSGTIPLPTVAMYFGTPDKVNKMFEGENVIPLIWKGIWHPGILKGFMEISKKLDAWMKPSDELLNGNGNLEKVVRLMLNAALKGSCQVAMNDPEMADMAGHMADGTLQVDIHGGPSAYLTKKGNEFMAAGGKSPETPLSFLEIKDVETAYKLFQGEVDAFAALGLCDIRIRGLVPFAEGITVFMDRLAEHIQ